MRFYLFLLTYLYVSVSYTHDCLSLAHMAAEESPQDNRARRLVGFYSFISAVYTQMNTHPAQSFSNEQDLLTLSVEKYSNPTVPIEAEISGLIQQVMSSPQDTNFKFWLDAIEQGQQFLDQTGLRSYDGIQQIHDAATYHADELGPPLCPRGQLLSFEEIGLVLKNYPENVLKKIQVDPRFVMVDQWRKTLPASDPSLKMGAELELFFEKDFFELFRNYLSSSKMKSIIESVEFPATCIRGILGSITDISTASTNKLNLTKIADAKSLPADLLWASLSFHVEQLHRALAIEARALNPQATLRELLKISRINARTFFDRAPMSFSNYMIINDTSRVSYYGERVTVLEFNHQRPYKNMAAYLESLLLLTSANKMLVQGLLDHKTQLNNRYTHHIHISYKDMDLRNIGELLQDSVALTMFNMGDNAFTTKTKTVQYSKNPSIDARHLLRIAPDKDHSRIEFRRQLGGWAYEDFLTWIYQIILKHKHDAALDTIKDFNQKEFKKAVFSNRTIDAIAGDCLGHIASNNMIVKNNDLMCGASEFTPEDFATYLILCYPTLIEDLTANDSILINWYGLVMSRPIRKEGFISNEHFSALPSTEKIKSLATLLFYVLENGNRGSENIEFDMIKALYREQPDLIKPMLTGLLNDENRLQNIRLKFIKNFKDLMNQQ